MFASLNGYCIRHFQVCLGLHRKSKVMASQRYVVIEGVLHFLCTFFFISFFLAFWKCYLGNIAASERSLL